MSGVPVSSFAFCDYELQREHVLFQERKWAGEKTRKLPRLESRHFKVFFFFLVLFGVSPADVSSQMKGGLCFLFLIVAQC